jgi:hypothetical protein
LSTPSSASESKVRCCCCCSRLINAAN